MTRGEVVDGRMKNAKRNENKKKDIRNARAT